MLSDEQQPLIGVPTIAAPLRPTPPVEVTYECSGPGWIGADTRVPIASVRWVDGVLQVKLKDRR